MYLKKNVYLCNVKIKKLLLPLVLQLLLCVTSQAALVPWAVNGRVTYTTQRTVDTVVQQALSLFAQDMKDVTGNTAEMVNNNARIVVYQLNRAQNKEMATLERLAVPILRFITRPESFWIGVRQGQIVVVGSDARGTAYAIMELSRRAGVSPWTWWNDATPRTRSAAALTWNDMEELTDGPAVATRGVDLVAEDVSVLPWSKTLNGAKGGKLDTNFYRRLFQLMLRLRANALWPPRQPSTRPWNSMHDCEAMADSFAIDILNGSNTTVLQASQPLPRTTTSRHNKHKRHKNSLTPARLWADDGWGYFPRLPLHGDPHTDGLLYRLVSTTAPHPTLWYSTTSPGLMVHQLSKAWSQQCQRAWVVSIASPKTASMQLSLFMDLAWQPDTVVRAGGTAPWMTKWLAQQVGEVAALPASKCMEKFFQLTAQRRPETMDWVSLQQGTDSPQPLQDTDWNAEEWGNELERTLQQWNALAERAQKLSQSIATDNQDAYFSTVVYPIAASAALMEKTLQAQEARHISRPSNFHRDDEALESAARAVRAHHRWLALTQKFNQEMAHGKWQGTIDPTQRHWPLFGYPALPDSITDEELERHSRPTPLRVALQTDGAVAMNASQYSTSKGGLILSMVGHSQRALELNSGEQVTYQFFAPPANTAQLTLALIPIWPISGNTATIEVTLDDLPPLTLTVERKWGDDTWAKSVLRGQQLLTIPVQLQGSNHTLSVRVVNESIVLDQWIIDTDSDRHYYLFPTQENNP